MIHAAMVALVDRLTAAGIPAALDERDLNPPGVLVLPPAVDYRFSGPCAGATWTLLAAVPDAGTGPALPGLSDLVERVRAALNYEVTNAVPATVTLSDGPPAPAYRLTYTSDI
jgi:hypothetical protein